MSAAKNIDPPTPQERLRYHLEQLEEQLDLPECFWPLMVHDIKAALKAFREMERTDG